MLLICAVATTDIPKGGKLLRFARYAKVRAEGAGGILMKSPYPDVREVRGSYEYIIHKLAEICQATSGQWW